MKAVPLIGLAGVLLALGIGSSARAEGADAGGPALSETLSEGVYSLRGSFDVAAKTHVVWSVLTDYDALPRFVHSIKASAVEKPSGGSEIVVQEFVGKALIFSKDMHVRLETHEQPERRITFQNVEKGDFDLYRGSWTIQKAPGGARLIYLLSAKPHGPVPPAIGRGAFKDAAVVMLAELRGEILRRATKPIPSQASTKSKEGGAP
jgi:hypothetical protein